MARALSTVSLGALAASLLFALLAALFPWLATQAWLPAAAAHLVSGSTRLGWTAAHRDAALSGALLAGLLALVSAVVARYGPRALPDEKRIAGLLAAGSLVRVLAALAPNGGFAWGDALGSAFVAAAGVLFFRAIRAAVPRGTKLADVARDPLTKGDDACFLHLRLGSMFLLLGLAGQAAVAVLAALHVAVGGWGLAADHLLLVGFGLPALFGVSHLVVPRLSGVPAIAAGAIKGELHSTMLGVVLLVFGFGFGVKGLVIAGGLVVFFAAFVFMGVLGANIMKNKSRTQRVTPGFAYIPWVFAGVLWVVTGVLLGLFLNVVRAEVLADRLPALRAIHFHLVLFGGALQLALAFAARLWVAEPVPFATHKWAFYALNVALALLAWGALADSPILLAESAALAGVGLAAWFIPLARHARAVAG